MVIRTNEVKEASVERGRVAGVLVRREFQFPGDLWLPRRENRCRQPPNNHTSYDYHTPGVYTRASYPPLSFTLSLSLSFPLSPSSAYARVPSYALLSLSRPSSSLLALLQIARRSYPASLEKNCSGFELLRVTALSFSRGSNYYSLFLRSRFKLF